MSRVNYEVIVGVFVLLGLLALGYLAIKLGRMEVIGGSGYTIYAKFSTVGGLRAGSSVEIAGVEIGRVERITLENFQARVAFRLNNSDLKLPEDSIASVRTKGLIGEQYVRISPGGSDQLLAHGAEITETEPPVDVMELIAQYAFGKI
jgi:phospholipid/cholesterol/gamma-HCH transport system substrate-binding protein